MNITKQMERKRPIIAAVMVIAALFAPILAMLLFYRFRPRSAELGVSGQESTGVVGAGGKGKR